VQVGAPGKPAYQQVADELRKAIAEGHLAMGATVGSTAQLMARYQVSSTVTRKAVDQLRIEGLVVGPPGKGVYVHTTPAEAAAEALALARLAEELLELREAVDDQLARLEAKAMDLCANVGMPYVLESGGKEAARAG
jgi:GntR family transcriptional regulator